MRWDHFTAALFDLDGVLTSTADVHRAAWSELFTPVLQEAGVAPYTEADYYAHIDGKPRAAGVRDLLASRGLTLPEGEPDDSPQAQTVHGLGHRKNAAFTAVLERDGVEAYPGSIALLDALQARGVAMAVVSSSQNAPVVLAAAGIADRFPVVVDGAVAQAEGLAGKPAPDTFLAAAQRLGVSSGQAVVLEDAESGVAAGRAGGFGLVVGVDRGAGEQTLTRQGADLVVTDLAELVP